MTRTGIVVFAGLLGVLGASTIVSRVRSPRPPRADVSGIIQLYGNETIVVETTTAGLREVRIGPETVIRDLGERTSGPEGEIAGAPAALGDLRPGRAVNVWTRVALAALPVAREIAVWGKGR
jgi:hypothetical protein